MSSWWQSNGAAGTSTRQQFHQYLAGMPEPVIPDHVLISADRHLEMMMDFRKTEISRIRRQLKRGKRKTMTSRFLEDIDRRILECAQKLCEKPQEHSLEKGETK